MHYAPSDFLDMPGHFLPEDIYARLRDVGDELQLLVALTATTHTLDGEILSMEFKRAALAGYSRGVQERIENVLQECRYPGKLSEEDKDDEEEEDEEDETPCASEPLRFGVTLDQIDEARRWIRRISAHGDMLASNSAGELAQGGLVNIGDVIFEEAQAAGDVIFEEAQAAGDVIFEEAQAAFGIVRRIDARRLKYLATAHAPAAPKADPAGLGQRGDDGKNPS